MRMQRVRAKTLASATLCSILALAIAFEAGRDALANAVARQDPSWSLSLERSQPRALAALFDAKLIATGGKQTLGPEDINLIKASVRKEPLNSALIRMLGIERAAKGGSVAARPLILLADRVSRRDVLSQMWLIEDAVQRNSIADALHHYDIALSTSISVQPILFPVLTGALSDPEARREIARLVSARRRWIDAFLRHIVSEGEPQEVAALMLQAGVVSAPQYRTQQTNLLGRLAGDGDIVGALRHARLMGASLDALQQFGFSASTTNPEFAPLTWRPSVNGDVQGLLDDHDQLQVSAYAGATGTAVFRTMVLSPGSYRFDQTTSSSDADLPRGAAWIWTCMTERDGRPIANMPIPLAAGSHHSFYNLLIPNECSGIKIELNVTSTDQPSGSELTVNKVSLTRN